MTDLTSAAVIELLDGLPTVVGSIKDLSGCYSFVTRSFAELLGVKRPADLVGKTARDLFPPDLAASYEQQDEHVLRTGEPLHGQVETIERHDGTRAWFVTSKSRLLVADEHGRGVPVGVTSMSVDLRAPESMEGESAQAGLASALHHLHRHLDERLTIDDLALVAGLSRDHLDRICRRSLGGSVGQIITRIRIDRAMHLLSHSDVPVGEVAQSCGFYDQSDFTRRFRSVTGRTPAAYRLHHPVHGLLTPERNLKPPS